MLLDFNELYKKYDLSDVRGIIHIGAHYGEEHETYEKYEHIKNYVYFEPLISNYEILYNKLSDKENVSLVKMALGNENKEVYMNVETANNGQSSSILEPKLHLKQYPHIVFDKKEKVKMVKLYDYFHKNKKINDYNFINIDVQGYELEVFKGAGDLLNKIDYIITEVNRDELYLDCPHIIELDKYLMNFNFIRLETTWDGITWGDAFYVKK
ncbi:MAG: FkbM family methyltransferase [bacterium]